ncbi:MAG: VanZ family protein [Porticoccaceae bacterium]|nr:VanZ family protein [Porticoccaceae bacterium]
MSTVALSLMPISGQQVFEAQDKIGHATVYATLYFLAVQAYGHRVPLWLLAAVLVIFGLSMELAQSMTSYRFGDPWDLLANTVGVMVIWLVFSARRRWQ